MVRKSDPQYKKNDDLKDLHEAPEDLETREDTLEKVERHDEQATRTIKAEDEKQHPPRSMTRKTSSDVIVELLGLKARLQKEIEDHPSDIVRTPLVNIRGDIHHLEDAIKQVESMER